uniref:uncharacterized protein LOC104266756 isoform X3 n=1 Tax=Ciona intestinalis TaxID=7719 RepID=UPI000EF48DFC|nr:uncharacterized protein LOC104266756 isoform X3 [Ciona intestinalis]|eukprot:XP_026696083.1 uncharacterized protein LOC104266756 isoform X3 [Ciona intestinalis]
MVLVINFIFFCTVICGCKMKNHCVLFGVALLLESVIVSVHCNVASPLLVTPSPNQATNSTVSITGTLQTSSLSWTIQWTMGVTVLAEVAVNTGVPAIAENVFALQTRVTVSGVPTIAGMFDNITTQLNISQLQTTDNMLNIITGLKLTTVTSSPIMLNITDCDDLYQGISPSNTAVFEGSATFKCVGANTVSVLGTCQADATWSISGTCPPVQCNTTAATDSANGIILTNSALLNTLVNVSAIVNVGCGDGFNGTGGSRTCQADGTWSASISCARVCNTSAVVSNGICLSSSVTRHSNVAVGSVVSLTCCVGYIPNNGSGTCANDGTWNTVLVCMPNVTTTDTTPIFTNNTTGTSQPTTTTKNTENPIPPPKPCLPCCLRIPFPRGCCCWWWCILLIILFFLIGILALVLWTIEFYRIYEPELGYGIKFLMLIGTVTVIPIVVFVIHQYCTRDRGGKSNDPVLVFGKKDWGVWFILCIWLPLIPGILMFRQWHEDVYLKKKQELQKKIPTKEELQKKLLEQVEPKQKWFMAICIVLGIPMVIYYFVDKSSVKQSNSSGDKGNKVHPSNQIP